MKTVADRRGPRWDWIIPEGVTWSPVVTYKLDGTTINTVASATLTISEGTAGKPSTSVLAPTVTVGSNTTMTFTLTQTNTRALTPGKSYTYALVATLANGSVVRVAFGGISVTKEVGT